MPVPDWRQPKRSELIAKYTDRPVTRYQQFDGWVDCPAGDSHVRPDEDGDAFTGGTTYELMRFNAGVRVLVPDGIAPRDAARVLSKIADLVERDLDAERRRRDEANRGGPPGVGDMPF